MAAQKKKSNGAGVGNGNATSPTRKSVKPVVTAGTEAGSGPTAAAGGADGAGSGAATPAEAPASVPPAGYAAAGASAGTGGATPAGASGGARPGGDNRPHNLKKAATVAAGGLPGPRKVRLAVSRVDPWSVVKFSFLISFAVGIMIIVASGVFWYVLDGMHVFTTVNDTIAEIAGEPEKFNILQWVTLERTLSLATIIALIDVVVLTALSTIFAFLYNLTAMLVGGITVTLTDE
ncbi:DUF3566 domain-containing protein [Rarobacter incanus]|uniref:Transmembrane protein DUF3566 n=1 Tax=Rarobacter incanus TaxID=153494 RepID=A0A542SPZ1_9MICO|nr:DUF3566 domain-containing protein [Rarobacter incanus]TQK76676.1 transmembrane protein DUF3566 [Rarobacter incanus]